jgi:hypothetical protein
MPTTRSHSLYLKRRLFPSWCLPWFTLSLSLSSVHAPKMSTRASTLAAVGGKLSAQHAAPLKHSEAVCAVARGASLVSPVPDSASADFGSAGPVCASRMRSRLREKMFLVSEAPGRGSPVLRSMRWTKETSARARASAHMERPYCLHRAACGSR